MLKIIKTLIFLCSVFPFLALGQANFFKGYRVTNEGDTIVGYIQGKESLYNPVSLKFRRSPEGKIEQYTIKDCSAFGVADKEKYERHVVRISLAENKLDELSFGLDTSSKTAEVFLKVLQVGKNVSLYAYSDRIKLRFYIKESTAVSPVELQNYSYYHPEQRGKIIHAYNFRNALFVLAKKYGVSENNDALFERATYDETDMLQLVSVINDKQPEKSAYRAYSFYYGLGLNMTSARYEGINDLANANTVNKSSLSPYLGVGIDVYANPAYGRTVFRAELGLFYNDNSFERTISTSNKVWHRFKQYNALLIAQMLYHIYNNSKVKIYVGGGFSMQYSYTGYNVSERSNYGAAYAVYAPKPEHVFFAIPFRTGMLLNKKIEFMLNYQVPTAITNYMDFSIRMQRMGIGVNYHLY